GSAGDDPRTTADEGDELRPLAAVLQPALVEPPKPPALPLYRGRKPSLLGIGSMETTATGAMHSWRRWWSGLQQVVGKVHNADAGDVAAWFELLTSTVVLVMSTANAAGK